MHRIPMASVHAVKKETWHEGDRCLAPDPKDGTLREATIQRLSTSPEGPVAWVVLTNQCKNEDVEEAVPVSNLLRSDLNHPLEEKPVFPNRIKDSMLCVPLELNVNGDRVPYTINRYLRDYQREGIRFMYDNYTRSRGCILGDDMGLGKTVQVIAFLAAVLHKTGTWEDIQKNRPHFLQSQTHSEQNKPNKVFLIVAPLSVLYNWKDELEIWGHFQCVVVHGLKKEEELARVKKGRTEIALTTYETLRLCLDEFNTIDWSAVVVDEAHRIKNPNSQITQAMKDLKCQIRIGLTGTILQNNLEELWCVMDWAIPGCLGSLGHFKNKYSYPIEQGQKHSTTKRTLAIGRKTVKALVRKISIWFLRRTKVHIKEQLPKKDDRVVFCSLTEFQQSVYQTVLDTEDVKLLLRSSEKCDCQSGRTRMSCCYKTNSEGVKVKELYFIYLAILRKVANNVALLQSTARTSKKQKKYIGTICAEVFKKFPDFVHRCSHESFEALSDPMYSGKMKVLEKLLKYYLQKRDKMLLFSLSTKLLDILESYCIAQGLDYSRLDGTTKAKERVQIVKEFNSSSHVNLCLVSTMAGGLGLNFVGANVVVLFDPTWNPANDLQAIDRAYRIGQRKDVTVLRLISLGSVEEIIYLRQVYKQQLQCTVVGKEAARRYFEAVHGDHKGELFGIKNLFRLQTQGTCLTQKILEREGQVEAGVMTTSVHKGEETAEKEERVSESAGPRDVADDKPISETRGGLQVPEAALDFSSGSEEDELNVKKKISNPSSVDTNKGGTVAPGQMTLLQHGFSKLLERVKGKPELAQGDSSSGVEESPFEEDAEDQNEKNAGNAGNQEACPKLGTKTWDISSSSDREDWENEEEGRNKGVSLEKQDDESIRKRHSLKGWTNKITEDEESDDNSSPNKDRPNKRNRTVKKTHHTEFYSDESEDLDIEIIKRSKKNTLQSCTEEDKRRKVAECNRNKPSMRKCWGKTTSKYKEDTEMFTSSEDEHTHFNKGRPTGCHFASPQTDRSRVQMDKYGQSSSTKERLAGTADAVSSLKCQAPLLHSRKDRTIDNVLGAVNEVIYTHSNQRVVGGSKAEELISRAAVRDVFERKMYSQLPANHIQDSSESLLASTKESQPSSSVVRLVKPTVDHPVTFAKKNVLHTEHTTFVIGETPQAIRRQQLEEMAEKFMFRSAHQFAVEILRSPSAQRLTWLRQYYTSLNHPGLSNTVTNNFPEPDSAQTPSSSSSRKTAATKSHTDTRTPQKHCLKAQKNPKYTQKYHKSKIMPENPQSNMTLSDKTSTNPQSGVQKPQKNLNVPQENILEPPNDVPSMESEGQEEMVCSARGHKRTKRGSVSGSRALLVGGGVGLDQASSSGLRSEEAAAFLDRDTRSSADFSHDRSTMLSKPTAQETKQQQKVSSWTSKKGQREKAQTLFPEQTTPTSSHSSFLADLIGDTSILDDLLKPKSRVSSIKTCTATPFSPRNNESGSLSSPKSTTQAAQQAPSKCSRKDFWDILTEGNEESINRLTDLAEVQRVCINTNFAAGSRAGETESKSLWKTNENFLWKK